MVDDHAQPPLAGLRVLDCSTGFAGPGAAMYLADYGADVIKVEPPGGDPARGVPPLVPGTDTGASFFALNRGKRSVVLDWRHEDDRAALEGLIAASDVVIAGGSTPDALREWPFDYDALQRLHPGLVYAPVTPWGRSGPYVDLPGYEPLVQAVSGITAQSLTRDGRPVPIGYRVAHSANAMLIAYGVLLALIDRDRSGAGQQVETSLLHSALAMLSVRLTWAQEDPTQRPDPAQPMIFSYRCADDRYISIITIQQRQWESMCRVLGLDHLIEDPDFNTAAARTERRAEHFALLEGILGTRPSHEWIAELGAASVPCGPTLRRGELFGDAQIAENDYATVVRGPGDASIRAMGSLVKLSETPVRPGARVPALGEHTAAMLASLGVDADGAPRATATPAPPPASSDHRLPLEGIRVLDLAIMYAGPGTAMYLGDMGADVIKVEHPAGDDSRLLGTTPYLGRNSAFYLSVNRNKRAMSVNLREPAGQAILHRLVATSDVLIHNFRPGVANRLGVDYPTLRAINPGLVYAWITAFGSRGPLSDKPVYDNVIQGYAGVVDARARRDGEPTGTGAFVADTAAPMLMGFSILAALRARERTGLGQIVEGSLLGVAMASQSSQWIGIEGDPGTDVMELGCPVFTCGDGRALMAALVTDGEWHAFCDALGLDELARDARFATAAQRGPHCPELASRVEARLADGSRDAWAERLRAAGVPCVAVTPRSEVRDEPHALANGFVQELAHPVVGMTRVIDVPVRLSRTPGRLRRYAPTFGEHTDALLAELGYSAEEIARARAAGAVS